MQQKKWRQYLHLILHGIQITLTFLTVPTLGSSVVGAMAMVLAPARSTSSTSMVMPAVTTRLALCLAFWTDEVSGSFGADEGQIVIWCQFVELAQHKI